MRSFRQRRRSITERKSKGEILVFRHGPKALKGKAHDDVENGGSRSSAAEETESDDIVTIEQQTAIIQWNDVCKGTCRILDHVDGWAKSGTLTALTVVSGAGKTTLLDVLATRTTIGVISGEALVDGKPRDESFQRKTGYAQQQDLHFSTATVREALASSASSCPPRGENKL
ncbi:hypothetical protein BJX63DRAFT_387386 [Aspergillus granulosus]|uniref:ABC transporter domain-containing protein n=1 Tax=Aspergillus granulosus TaxID=176169 RepID=A0ABR4HLU2_9EURO